MLQSPGHSPRTLSSPSPSISETPVHQTPRSTTSSSKTVHTNPRKRNSSTVLDEDTYVAAIEKIIQRDFFPDIPKLRDRLDWLEATRTGDPMLIRDAQLKIIERRSGKTVMDTEGKIRTPGSTFFRNTTPLEVDRTPGTDRFVETDSVMESVENEGSVETDKLSLDEFFRKYTSEDNDSFSKLIEKVNKKKRERYEFLLEGENRDGKGLIEDSKKDRVTDGYGTSDQPLATLDGWKYTAKNLLMYHPADRGEVALTEQELANRLHGMTKEIKKTNTRFHGKMAEYTSRGDDEVAVLYNPVAGGTPVPWSDRDGDKMKKYDLEDLRKTPNQFYVESSKKADNGYSFVKTPSPAPGVDESPFITWGEIEGTPLRLEPEDTPIDIGGSGNGAQFNIPLPPSRDVKAHDLSREASRKMRDRSRMFQKPPRPSGGASPGGRTLSPAAQKFVRNAIAKSHSSSVDESLRASYRGSSPGFGTPKSGRSASRFGADGSMRSRSPSVREGSNPPW
ncbi:putative nuclear protein DGCR14/ESS-2 [Helianthus annuus]|uniref:Nuclear protein DGCR14/ESS-2 n=1 Tax=Helianthus annuus TaxID=4232 RepID=A0A9K3JC71_HELAN|nr:splicing factor ESS-2 homolog [Helianthus annuus]KAF5812199.1 putative nuclear protein DGCR14/ESS-2 [Helianthus annuus]KAJ0582785.1 putative nuclear protein DGCR14/ESS-2 [Helianthus annuus]KAJ0598762.1 putative nuclear protein DGCR14/ESS-2 [Helianthus annuus]KAJ0763018.1 putative nuclear protein DGCR14/ESS-2 [Helianthus annuus]KAJ0928964.1 putative nuclear protein DGCR14/ESS-2 [Helianthus annuus]